MQISGVLHDLMEVELDAGLFIVDTFLEDLYFIRRELPRGHGRQILLKAG